MRQWLINLSTKLPAIFIRDGIYVDSSGLASEAGVTHGNMWSVRDQTRPRADSEVDSVIRHSHRTLNTSTVSDSGETRNIQKTDGEFSFSFWTSLSVD